MIAVSLSSQFKLWARIIVLLNRILRDTQFA